MKRLLLTLASAASAAAMAVGAAHADPGHGHGRGRGDGGGWEHGRGGGRDEERGRGDERGGWERGRGGGDPRRGWSDGPPPEAYAPQYAPRGYGVRRGGYMPPQYRGEPLQDYGRYRLRPPPRGYTWMRVGGSYVLMSMSTGQIFDVVPY